jgi:hypothetical protein
VLQRRGDRGGVLVGSYEQNSKAAGVQKDGQFVFVRGQPALLATHEYDGLRIETIPQTLLLISAEAHPDHNVQILAANLRQRLKSSFDESYRNRRGRS